jgi:hypothetical protein
MSQHGAEFVWASSVLFARLERATSLGVNVRNMKLLPLLRNPDLLRVKRRLLEAALVWSNMEVVIEAFDLGVLNNI